MSPPSESEIMDAKAALHEARCLWGDEAIVTTSQEPGGRVWYHVGIRLQGIPGEPPTLLMRGVGLTWEAAFADHRIDVKARLERSKRKEPGLGFRPKPRRDKLRLVKGA